MRGKSALIALMRAKDGRNPNPNNAESFFFVSKYLCSFATLFGSGSTILTLSLKPGKKSVLLRRSICNGSFEHDQSPFFSFLFTLGAWDSLTDLAKMDGRARLRA